MRYSLLSAFALLFLLFTGCREEGETIRTDRGDIPPPTLVTGTVTTIFLDRSGNTVDDVAVTGLGSAGEQNPDGSFTIRTAALDPNGTNVTVTAPGMWPEHRTLMPSEGGELRETFVMEPKEKAGEIDPTSGGTITLPNNLSVTLPQNTVARTPDGEVYDGPVEIYVNHDAPEDLNEMLNSPGNALAQMPDGSMAALESYGMMDIALETPDGDPLVLDDATKAEVRMPIDPDTESRGPDQVPFWVLSPEGFWLPAGTATLAPGCYVVYIVSSSTCNVDVPHPVTQIKGRFVDAGGFPLTHSPFAAQLDGGMFCSVSRVDCEGYFRVNVAANRPLVLIVEDPCTQEQTIFAIDPVDENTLRDLGELVVDLSNAAFAYNVTDCSGAGLPTVSITEIWANGYGGNNGEYFAPREDGTGVLSVVNCGEDDVIVQAFTNDFRAASQIINRSSDDVGPETLVICGDLDADEIFNLQIDGEDIPVTELAPIYWPNNGEYNWQIRATGMYNGEEYSLFFRFSDPAEGEFPNEEAFAAVYRLAPGAELGEGRVYVDPEQEINLVGTSFQDNVFEGSFEATMNLQNDVTQTVEAVNLPVKATFRIRL